MDPPLEKSVQHSSRALISRQHLTPPPELPPPGSTACAAVQTGFREDLFGCVSPGRSVHRLSDGRLSLQPRCLSGTADP
ncbi:Endothelin receptor type B [Dissostichus eleginoides]|uniref:Endothelin receptor type B n=1 Tax=Dissostichus eleginoides TaxID=100907 RepID=A0AAD9BSJ3_DISEL|nr:Endothelin receptor type B [Dissostichus eleginoides]